MRTVCLGDTQLVIDQIFFFFYTIFTYLGTSASIIEKKTLLHYSCRLRTWLALKETFHSSENSIAKMIIARESLIEEKYLM